MSDAEKRKEAVVDEVAAIELGDSRLNFRARSVSGRLAMNPALSFPEALATEADLEGFYRMIRNERVTAEAILAPHQQATAGRIAEQGTVLAVHDSTEFIFGGDRSNPSKPRPPAPDIFAPSSVSAPKH